MYNYKFLNKFNRLCISDKVIILIAILGLLPFIFGLIDLWINKKDLIFIINIPKYYGCIILTFLGAIYWGVVLSLNPTYNFSEKTKICLIIWSIIPSIICIIIALTNDLLGIIILILSFIFSQIFDEFIFKYIKFSEWYLILRRILTLIVVLILIISLFIMVT